MHKRIPSWWKEADVVSGMEQLYQEEKPVICIVPITSIESILGRLPLIPEGDYSTIPAALRGSKK